MWLRKFFYGRFKVIIILLCFISSNTYAWNSIGHKVIAQIAYDHLTPKARKKVDKLTLAKDNEMFSGKARFLYISTWADFIRGQGDHRFDSWHYIGLPISADGTAIKQQKVPNVVWAIEKAEKKLSTKNTPVNDKKLYLKLLVHFVGDVHQPLHTVNRYSGIMPNGDRGGNGVKVHAPYANNLHRYWDDGVGLFRKFGGRYPSRHSSIRQIASVVEQKYPMSVFSSSMLTSPPMKWAEEGRIVSARFAYHLQYNHRPSQNYVIEGQKIVTHRLALAGYRLATILNNIYN